jgi:signal transduction histidine kinase
VFLFYIFVRNFPSPGFVFRPYSAVVVLALMAFSMALAASPYVFRSVTLRGNTIIPEPGSLIPLFGAILVFVSLLTFVFAIRKYLSAIDLVRRQWLSISAGFVVAYSLLILLVFMRVILHDDPKFVAYAPLFILPIFVGAAYSILRHHLFRVNVVATEILTFVILLASFAGVLIAESFLAVLLGLFVTLFILVFGILLVRSVLREVEQREKLEQLTKELEAANSRLRELDRLKSEFLSFASHQVRSPMSVVKGYATLIFDGSYGEVSEKVKETAKKIKDAADRLIELVNNLLDLRRIEEGKMQYTFEAVDLSRLVSDVVAEFRQLAEGKHLSLSLETSPDVPNVRADSQKLRQVIQNFIDNAVKYTDEGWIKVAVNPGDSEKKTVIVSVCDSGRGISAELLPHLFQQFSRDVKVAKHLQGTGLGLYIAKQVVNAHQGSVWAESKGEGKGSCFYLRLPVS